MSLIHQIQKAVIDSLKELYKIEINISDFQVNETKPEFTGDYTVVLFSLLKTLKKSPEELGNTLGKYLTESYFHLFSGYNVIKGFLNLSVANSSLTDFIENNFNNARYGHQSPSGKRVMVEYASPNTNKPLHLGHLRNIFLGWSTAEILKARGNEVFKSSIVNDRGIHICKSMIAWQQYGEGETPDSTGTKGDHLVGKYYVKFNEKYQKEVADLVTSGMKESEAKKEAPIMKQTQQMLIGWETGDVEVRALWEKMNGWVYDGFDETFKRIGADFDKTYYESNTYLLGKDFVMQGLDSGAFYKKEDGSIWIDLSEAGMDEKLLLRGDGTSVYITQDMGLVKQKFEEFNLDESLYVIGDEQIYHMKVLKEICKKLEMPFANNISHLSYGMVELTTGKMKSREGTVVDADDIIDEMIQTAKQHTEELGKVKDFTEEELKNLYHILGLGAMKFYLLRVEPKKRMVFNPEESIDFHGFTGPFVQYTYARIQSILRKITAEEKEEILQTTAGDQALVPEKLEREVMLYLEKYPETILQAASEFNPSVIAAYAFYLAKTYNSFYAEHSVTNAENNLSKKLRLQLSIMTANVINSAMGLLGMQGPEGM
ncbi:arginine--tRNA ligase [soil metagenome]